MSARETIFSAIRHALNVTGEEAPRRMAVGERLVRAPQGLIPARGQGEAGARLETFKSEAARAQASLAEVATFNDAPGEIVKYLRDNNLPATVRRGEDKRLAAMPWAETLLEIAHGASDGHDLNGVSAAFAAVAETGTLVMASGPDNPVTLNFLPETHIVVLEAKDVVGPYEDAWMKIRARFGDRTMPRTVNMISGPSRTGDIGGRLVMGAHGPRRMCVVVVRG